MTLRLLVLAGAVAVCSSPLGRGSAGADTTATAATRILNVPDDFGTIQQAIDAAGDGDTVLIAPGVYHETLRIAGKSICLASWRLTKGDDAFVRSTVLDGSIHPDPTPDDDLTAMQPQVILVEKDAGPATTIFGLTIRDGDDGIACHAKVRILFNRFINNVDAIDYENGGGQCMYNTFVANDDDGVDIDESSEVEVAHNEIRDNDNDGIEIRLHEYSGPLLRTRIYRNRITGNGEDGIQIIGYPNVSPRAIVIERNVIAQNAMAGIGCMSNANSDENYEGAPLEERIVVANNTICENQYGLCGGSNALVLNNIFANNHSAAMKRVAGRSELRDNLLWSNALDAVDCSEAVGTIVGTDPQLDAMCRPCAQDTCRDGGSVYFDPANNAHPVVPASYGGPAPDLGAHEAD